MRSPQDGNSSTHTHACVCAHAHTHGEREGGPGPSISAYMVVKSSSLTTTLIPSGGVSSRFFNSFASFLMTFGGRFSLVAYMSREDHEKDLPECWEYGEFMTKLSLQGEGRQFNDSTLLFSAISSVKVATLIPKIQINYCPQCSLQFAQSKCSTTLVVLVEEHHGR